MYPRPHPHHEEIQAKKKEIDELFKLMILSKELAREQYTAYVEFSDKSFLKQMGVELKKVDDYLDKISTELINLEDIITKPTI